MPIGKYNTSVLFLSVDTTNPTLLCFQKQFKACTQQAIEKHLAISDFGEIYIYMNNLCTPYTHYIGVEYFNCINSNLHNNPKKCK